MLKKNVAGITVVAASMALIALCLVLVYASSSPARPQRQAESGVVPPHVARWDVFPRDDTPRVVEQSAAEAEGQAGRRSSSLMLSGTVEPSVSIEVHSDVAGHIGRLAVDIGATVHRGDVLAEIDSPALRLALSKARVAIQRARARITTTKAGVKVADSVVKTARAEWESSQAALRQAQATADYRRHQYERIAELVKKGALQNRIGEEEQARIRGDEASESAARARVAIMRASLASAEAKLDAAIAEVGEMEESLHLAEVEFEEARMNLESSLIRSPIDGIVTRRRYHAGEFVRSAASEASDPIFTVVQTRTVRVVAHVSDRDAPLVQVGNRASFRPEAADGRGYEGRVSRTAFAEDPSTQTMRIEVDLDNNNGRLRPGQRGTVGIDLPRAS